MLKAASSAIRYPWQWRGGGAITAIIEKDANVNAEGRFYDNMLTAASCTGHEK